MAARRTAEYLGLTVTGTIGVLIKAKQRGLIPAVLPVLEELESNGFFISERVKRMIAAKTGEQQKERGFGYVLYLSELQNSAVLCDLISRCV